MNRCRCLVLLLLSTLLFRCQEASPPGSPPFSPDAALNTFQLAEGFQLELVAAEPLIADPVALEIDEQGRFWVVEMHGYPLDLAGSGIIKVLEDTDGDGRPDAATVFADSLVLPTGIMRWRDGVIVTDAPDVLYLEDTDGDGRADRREVLLTGFARSNPQHNLNTPRFELDNWIYLGHEGAIGTKRFAEAFGDRGAGIHFPAAANGPSLPQNASGRSVRFNPAQQQLEMLASKTQFGYTFDPWGHLLNCSNYNYLYHEVIAARYLARNPDLPLTTAVQHLPAGGPGTEVFPITRNPEHQLLTDVGVITSGCGVTWYKGGLFPPPYDRVTFIAEPVHNLVHTDIIEAQGATFTASRQFTGREFLASTDPWFRPVNFYTGPDGALYLLDYYRQIIEHPEWMSDEINQSGQLYNGSDQGRIYRIVPEGGPSLDFAGKLTLGEAPRDTLIELLGHANSWWRRQAQRLLVSRAEAAAIPDLMDYCRFTTSPLGKVHALWAIEGLGGFDAKLIIEHFHHPVAGVRENTIRLAELHLQEVPVLADELLRLTGDTDAKVRYQLLCTLGFLTGAEAEKARLDILLQDINDPWVQLAALSGSANKEWQLMQQVAGRLDPQRDTGTVVSNFFGQAASAAGRRGAPAAILAIIDWATAQPSKAADAWRAGTLRGLTAGLKLADERPALIRAQGSLIRQFTAETPASLRHAALELLPLTGIFDDGKKATLLADQAIRVATDTTAAEAYRTDALFFLGQSGAGRHIDALKSLIRPEQPASVQTSALHALGATEGTATCQFLLNQWESLTPSLRDQAIDIFMKDGERRLLLLEAVAKGAIQPSTIGWRRTVSLLNAWDDEVRRRAREVLEGNERSRDEAVAGYQAALTLPADADRGSQVFSRSCAACHQMSGQNGLAFGPDLAAVRNRTKAAILNDILRPNQAIADGYEWWIVKMKDGTVASGIIAGESSETLTLRNTLGQESMLRRANIATLEAQERSAMPNGLESQISEQEMADLLAFLKHE